MANKILAFLESKDGKFKNSAFEVITEALKIAEESLTRFIGKLPKKSFTQE